MELKKVISKCAETRDSFYLYDEKGILESVENLKSNFPETEFLYSIKCNPDPRVLRCVFCEGFGADAASAGEVRLAHEAGLPSEKIFYSAPGKSDNDIEETITSSVIIADSIDEIGRVQAAAEKRGMIINIGIRIDPDFTFDSDKGRPSKFGIDEEQAIEFAQNCHYSNIKITGIHVHLKSQELSADVLASYYKKMFRLAEKFEKICGGLEYVNMGSGIGVNYAENEEPLNISSLASDFRSEFERFRSSYQDTKVMIETGRYAVCRSGYYVTKVMDRKVSRGKTYVLLKNTLNAFMRPSLAELVRHYSGESSPAGTEPLFTSEDAFQFLTLKEGVPEETVTLAGNLCTAADVFAADIRMPKLERGDIVIVTNAGSYAAALSPMQFSSQEKPEELFLTKDGKLQ